MDNNIKNNELASVFEIIGNEIDAVYEIDYNADYYRAIKSSSMFERMFGLEGTYFELSRKIIFNFIDKKGDVTPEYDIFIPYLNQFNGKFSRKMKIYDDDKVVIIQMTIYPTPEEGKSILLLTEVDSSDYSNEEYRKDKDSVINSTYLFSMYVDLNKNVCSSVSITELSDSPINNADMLYSEWREDIVNMMYQDDKKLFIKYSDPTYLRNNLKLNRPMSVEVQMMNLEGKYIWVRHTYKRIPSADENDYKFVFMVQDIHEIYMRLQDDIKKYEELSNKDSLTGIFNHGKIESELAECIENFEKSNEPVSLFMFDIDYFKNVNDIHGHATGDYVLKTLVLMVKDFLSEYRVSLGRWGGEEFIGICYDIKREKLVEITQKLRTIISEYDFETVGKLTCSFGITQIYENEKISDVFDRLDKAMYAAKNSGRDCVISA